MAKGLRPQQERFFEFLSRRTEGEVVSVADILASTGWQQSTLDTYRNKNILDPFLTRVSSGGYRVLRNGTSLSKGDVAAAFTQVRPSTLVLAQGTRAKGEQAEYELQRELGQGAVAHVWAARRSTDGAEVAIKVVNPRPDLLEPSVFSNVKLRFAREAKNGIKLEHPNIVRYLDVGEVRGHAFVAMDLADRSLASILAAKRLEIEESLHAIECCANGLAYLHGQQCVHRDVKPANILKFGNRLVLGDLGIVRWSDLNPAFTSAATITRASVQLGSWFYMAPEQRTSPHEATALSDIYALGISWYEMLTGITPDPAAVGAQVFSDPSTDPRINELIRHMLRYQQQDRPDAARLLADLDALKRR